MSNLFSSILLVSLALPLAVLRIPLSSIVFFAYFTILAFRDIYRRKLSLSTKLIAAYAALLALLFTNGTSLDGIDSVLALGRYFLAFLPILLFPSLRSFALNNKLNSRYCLSVLSVALLFLGIWSALPVSQCVTTYGGKCILFQVSSSFGAFASIAIVTFSFYIYSLQYSLYLKSVSILNSLLYFYLGAIQGARSFWIFAGLTLLFLSISMLANILSRRKISINKILVYSIVSSPLLWLVPFFINMSSFNRLIPFLLEISSDSRIQDGYILGSKLSLSLSEFFVGRSLFSQLYSWDANSAYDSSLNLLLSDFGVIGAVFMLSLASVSILSVLRSSMPNMSRLYCKIFISVYVIANVTNEFIFLKGVNPLFIVLLSLLSLGKLETNMVQSSGVTQADQHGYNRC